MSEQIQLQQTLEFKELLNKAVQEKKISNWKLHTSKRKRSNVYVEKDYTIESLLKSERVEYIFQIYKEFEDSMGEASFTLGENDSKEVFEKELKDAIFICSHAKSKKFILPTKEDEFVKDESINYNEFYNEKFFKEFENNTLSIFVAEKLNLFKELIEKNQTNEVILKLNSFEFHNTLHEKEMESSEEITKGFKKNVSYVEFVLTAKDSSTQKETEHIVYEKVNDIYTFDFEEFFNENIEKVKDTTLAQPCSSFTGKILLTHSAVKDFFIPDLTMNAVIGHTSARMKFQKISNYEIGKKVIDAKLDSLTVYSNPLLKENNSSVPYDDDGITSKKVCLIKEGVVENFFAGKKFADYLGIKPTGILGSIEVEAGSKTRDELFEESDEMIHIVSFSSFTPDLISGDFSAEIRLGYKIKNGQKEAFKGGLFTGNMFKLFEKIEFSKERVEESGYLGPKVVKFHDSEVVGL